MFSLLFGQVSIPNIGVETGLFISEAIHTLGAIVAVAVGGYAAFLVVRRGLRWLGTALR